jgi:hypothetical protein
LNCSCIINNKNGKSIKVDLIAYLTNSSITASTSKTLVVKYERFSENNHV